MTHIADASTLDVIWWKAEASGAQSDCVECAIVTPEQVAVRDSKNPSGPALLLPRASLAGLVAGIKSGAL